MLGKIISVACFLFFLNNLIGLDIQRTNEEKPLPEPYASVEVLPFDSRSHFGEKQAKALKYLIEENNVQTVVEIGSFLGASTRFMAKLLPEHGKVYAIDHWLGNQEWQDKPGFKEEQMLFYKKFLSNVIHENLCEKIIPMNMKSLDASCVFNDTPDLIFIDGSHDFQSVYEDICAWYPFVEGGGVLCGDDYEWGESKPVKRAVLRFAKEHNLHVKTISNWVWYYEK